MAIVFASSLFTSRVAYPGPRFTRPAPEPVATSSPRKPETNACSPRSQFPQSGAQLYKETLIPRLTNPQYLAQRTLLRGDWFERDAFAISQLDPLAQMELYAYFAHTGDLTDEEAIAHRKVQTKIDPALPQVAGRHYARIASLLGERPEPKPVAPSAVAGVARSKT